MCSNSFSNIQCIAGIEGVINAPDDIDKVLVKFRLLFLLLFCEGLP